MVPLYHGGPSLSLSSTVTSAIRSSHCDAGKQCSSLWIYCNYESQANHLHGLWEQSWITQPFPAVIPANRESPFS
ncbi:hypothetical protein E2C01_092432 [Portunus trituberculatus]|uniref:Uncharacterized protein n=1 Tax=Portunus trituberculatus TaxID=210409 RepID=A0A5B7JVS7_PORTR|nr:hypothetical protein [Portunus trituberculatus]